ncbi:MAG: YtxH domain-containing protein [Slackia sp.]
MGNKFSAFVVGGLVGAGVALLCAPRKGVETRALVAEKASTAFGQAKTVGDQAVERGQALYEDAVVQGQKAYDYAVAGTQAAYTDVTLKGRQAYETAAQHVQGAAQKAQKTADAVKPAFSEKNDELRAKIDAARERIAAQVAKNAEAAHAAVAEKVPVAAQK